MPPFNKTQIMAVTKYIHCLGPPALVTLLCIFFLLQTWHLPPQLQAPLLLQAPPLMEVPPQLSPTRIQWIGHRTHTRILLPCGLPMKLTKPQHSSGILCLLLLWLLKANCTYFVVALGIYIIVLLGYLGFSLKLYVVYN